MINRIFLGVLLPVIVMSVSLIPLSYSDYPSPAQQIRDGAEPDDIQCNADRIHAVRTNGNHVCVNESTAQRMGWEIIKTEFVIPAKTIDANTSPIITDDTPKQNLDALNFPITSDVEFSGQAYGYYDPQTLRRPPPVPESWWFKTDHYDMPQILRNNALALSEGTTTPQILLANTVTSHSEHDNAIDYRQWMPTSIPAGFELKWIDINQPEVFNDDMGHMQIKYMPNAIDVTGNMTTYEFSDIALLEINVDIHPYREDRYFPQETINRVTKNGTSTQVLAEEKYGGIYETIVASPANPNVKAVILHTHNYQLTVGGKSLPLETYEDIFLEIFERQ